MKLPTKMLALLSAFGLTGCAATGVDYLIMPPMGVGWKLGRQWEQREVQHLKEFVREGETLDNWTDLITWHALKKGSTPVPLETLLNSQREAIRAICPSLVWNIIERKERAVLYEWRISNCKPSKAELEKLAKGQGAIRPDPKVVLEKFTADQHAIDLYIEGEWTIWRISYTAKVKELAKEKRAEWIQWLSDAKVETKSR